MPVERTSITIDKEVMDQVRACHKDTPKKDKLNVSAVCEEAIKEELRKRGYKNDW